MHAPRSNGEHQKRLQGREAQTRAWAPALPDVTLLQRTPYEGGETAMLSDGLEANWLPRQRIEWETRDTLSNRMWSNLMETGPKQVTAPMLAAHPSNGAETMQPAAARTDQRPYTDRQNVSYFPDSSQRIVDGAPIQRPPLPPKNLFQNPWSAGYDIESGDVAHELRGVVKENNRHLTQDSSARIAGRTFEHQWIPEAATRQIAERKIDASELLRPSQDDYRRTYLSTPRAPPL